jgi:hypothetical protein
MTLMRMLLFTWLLLVVSMLTLVTITPLGGSISRSLLAHSFQEIFVRLPFARLSECSTKDIVRHEKQVGQDKNGK